MKFIPYKLYSLFFLWFTSWVIGSLNRAPRRCRMNQFVDMEASCISLLAMFGMHGDLLRSNHYWYESQLMSLTSYRISHSRKCPRWCFRINWTKFHMQKYPSQYKVWVLYVDFTHLSISHFLISLDLTLFIRYHRIHWIILIKV